ncbi:MAG: glycosyltransferase [Nitrospira sp.]|nr:glycosyltransferase [Nitrospira sp.]
MEQQIKGLMNVGLNVQVLFVNRAQGGIFEYLLLKKGVIKACQRFDPDIVHCMYGGVMADIVTRTIIDRPTVVSFCGSDLLGELLSGLSRKVVSYGGILASFRAAKRANGVVVKSLNLKRALPKSVVPSKIRIIPNGVDLARFRPLNRNLCRKHLGWRNDWFHILFPTNGGDPRKRIDLAFSAIEVLNRGGVKAELHELKGVTHQHVPIWLNACDVVLLTSLHEGSPNIIKEALACNIAIVSVDVGDVCDRIALVEGCHIAMPCQADLAMKLQLVCSGSRRVVGRKVLQGLSLEEVARRLATFYSELF